MHHNISYTMIGANVQPWRFCQLSYRWRSSYSLQHSSALEYFLALLYIHAALLNYGSYPPSSFHLPIVPNHLLAYLQF